MEAVADFIFLNSKITVASDCIHEIKRHLLFGKKVMTNLDSLLKTRALTIQTLISKVRSLLFNMLSRFVTAFLLRSEHLYISRLQSLSAVIWDPQENKSASAFTFSLLFAMK